MFILGFFAAVCLSAVLLARSTKHRKYVRWRRGGGVGAGVRGAGGLTHPEHERSAVTAGAAALYGFLLLILLTAERDYGDATGTKDDVGYETQFVGRVVILAFMVLYVLGGLCGWLGLHAALEVRAGVRPVGASAGRA